MNTSMMQALVAIAWSCKSGFANSQSAHALDIIADALLRNPSLGKQRLQILHVAEKLIFDGQASSIDGDCLLEAARTIALMTEQRNEDRYVWGD